MNALNRHPNHNAEDLIHAVERILTTRLPEYPNQYWPTGPDEDTGPDSEGALNGYLFKEFEYCLLSKRYAGEADDDDERIALSPDFRREAVLDAMAEILRFLQLNLREKPLKTATFENAYLNRDLKELLRKHLTRLLGRWYDLEEFGTGGVS